MDDKSVKALCFLKTPLQVKAEHHTEQDLFRQVGEASGVWLVGGKNVGLAERQVDEAGEERSLGQSAMRSAPRCKLRSILLL